MINDIINFLKDFLPKELVIFVVSMLPIAELRGGLLAAAALGINWYIAFPICVIGNILPIPFELLFIRKIFNWMKKFKGLGKIVDKLDKRAKEKAADDNMRKYLSWGLFILVAIPLPGTGAWTGGLVADVMDIRIKKAIPIIMLGVIAAGLITSVFSHFLIPLIF